MGTKSLDGIGSEVLRKWEITCRGRWKGAFIEKGGKTGSSEECWGGKFGEGGGAGQRAASGVVGIGGVGEPQCRARTGGPCGWEVKTWQWRRQAIPSGGTVRRSVEKWDIAGTWYQEKYSSVFCSFLKMVDIRDCFRVDGNKLLRKRGMMEERKEMVQPKCLWAGGGMTLDWTSVDLGLNKALQEQEGRQWLKARVVDMALWGCQCSRLIFFF